MLKLGIVGLGDIAEKAYLPVLSSKEGVAFHIFTRNQVKLSLVGDKYRFENRHQSLDSLIESGIKGAFVHSSTESHHEIIKQLLSHNIHVYVDKPITYHYESSKQLIELAESRNLMLMTGFNRRYAPTYQKLKDLHDPNLIIMQKNRKSKSDDTRRFVFDDFIHVADTLRYLFPYPIENMIVNGKKKDNILYHVVVQLVSNGGTAIGIMNRDSGTTEERVEVMSPAEKRTVYNVSELVIQKDKNDTKAASNDWEPTLHKRGFEQIASDFIHALKASSLPMISNHDALLTHELCEKIVDKLDVI